VINFTTVACRISSRLKWYKNYKNRLRLAKVIVKNEMSRFFLVQCVYTMQLLVWTWLKSWRWTGLVYSLYRQTLKTELINKNRWARKTQEMFRCHSSVVFLGHMYTSCESGAVWYVFHLFAVVYQLKSSETSEWIFLKFSGRSRPWNNPLA